jgi:hypothetical protein
LQLVLTDLWHALRAIRQLAADVLDLIQQIHLLVTKLEILQAALSILALLINAMTAQVHA